jgi:hypothetical protein
VPNVPPFLSELEDEDARWLHGAGKRLSVRAGEVIVSEDFPPRHLYVVVEGEFETPSAAGEPVRAATDGVLLCISREVVEAKLARDPAFERRLDKVIAKLAPPRRRPSEQPQRAAGKSAHGDDLGIPAEFNPNIIKKLLKGI